MQTAAFQLAGTDIRCNAICPGLIETGMTAAVYAAARARGTERRIGQINPLMRGGIADEVARVALFLASDECVLSFPVCSCGAGGRARAMLIGGRVQELVCQCPVLGSRRRPKRESPDGAGKDGIDVLATEVKRPRHSLSPFPLL